AIRFSHPAPWSRGIWRGPAFLFVRCRFRPPIHNRPKTPEADRRSSRWPSTCTGRRQCRSATCLCRPGSRQAWRCSLLPACSAPPPPPERTASPTPRSPTGRCGRCPAERMLPFWAGGQSPVRNGATSGRWIPESVLGECVLYVMPSRGLRIPAFRLPAADHQIIPVHHLGAAAKPQDEKDVGGRLADDLCGALGVIGNEAATDFPVRAANADGIAAR